jgi:hypothetical protein
MVQSIAMPEGHQPGRSLPLTMKLLNYWTFSRIVVDRVEDDYDTSGPSFGVLYELRRVLA